MPDKLQFAIATATAAGTRFHGPFKTADQAARWAVRSLTSVWSIIPLNDERIAVMPELISPRGRKLRRRKHQSKRHARP